MKRIVLPVFALTALVLVAQAQPRKPARSTRMSDAGLRDGATGPAVPKETPKLEIRSDAGVQEAVETKTLDGGAKIYRFGELEIEARLKSPQLVYFLRRVRAEFATGELGHRSFMGELSETRDEPAF
jgi:hypothetical protein